jgi:Putative beta-barrel porin 2
VIVLPRSIAVLAVLVCTAELSSAQTLAEHPQGPIHLGRVSLTPAVSLSNLGIDTNVFSSDTDRKSDFTFTVHPRLDGLVNLGRVRVLAGGGADYVYFHKYAEERSLRPVGTGQIEMRIAQRSAVYVRQDAVFARDAVNGEIDRRVSWTETRSRAGVTLGLTRRVRVNGAVTDDRSRFDHGEVFHGVALDTTLDRERRGVDADVEYAATSVTSAVFSTRVWRDGFVNMPSRNQRAGEYVAGLSFKPRALVEGQASAGIRVSSAANGVTPTYTGGIATIDLQYTLRDATRFGFSFGHTSEYSYDPLYPYYRLNRYGGIVRRHLFGPTEAAAGAELQQRAYEPFVSTPFDVDLRDSTMRYQALFGVRVLRRARIGVEANYFVQSRGRHVPSDYDGLRVGVMASYGIFAVGDRVASK